MYLAALMLMHISQKLEETGSFSSRRGKGTFYFFPVLGASVEDQRSLWPVRRVLGAILRLLQDVRPEGKGMRSEGSEDCM